MSTSRARKGLLSLLFVGAMAAVLVACGQEEPTPTSPPAQPTPTATSAPVDPIDQLYQDALAEGGAVVVMTNDDLYTRIGELSFARRFPGISVETELGSPTERASNVIAQSQAGRITTDIVLGSGRDVEPIVSRGLVAGPDEVDWAMLGYGPELVHAEGHLGLHWDFVYAHGYNTELVDRSELPATLEDFKDPKWRGKIVASPFLYPAGMAFVALARGEEEGVRIAKEVFEAAEVTLTTSQQQLVESGEASIVMFSSINDALLSQKNGASIDYFFTPDMGTARLGFVILKEAPHPAAARLFTHWMSTAEGQADLYDLDRSALVAGPGVDNVFTQIVEEQNVQLVLESDENWRERARLTGVVREAVVGQ